MQCRLIQFFSTTKKEVPAVAEEHDELNMRRRKREELRQKQLRERRRLRIALIAAAVVLLACGIGISFIARSSQAKSSQAQAVPQTTAPSTRPNQTEATQAASRRRNTQTIIHIKAAGDLNVTNSVVEAGLAATGYDFTRAFLDVAPVLADADLTVMNFEGNVCGEPYGTERASAPREILQGLRSAGVDLVQTANSYSIFNGLIGMTSTLRAVEEAGLQGVGAFASDAD